MKTECVKCGGPLNTGYRCVVCGTDNRPDTNPQMPKFLKKMVVKAVHKEKDEEK